IGNAAALQLIAAGHEVGYAHYRPFSPSTSFFLVLVVLQAAAVWIGLRARRKAIQRFLLERFRPWQLLLLAAVSFLFAAAPSADPKAYITELTFAAFVDAVQVGSVALAVVSLPSAIRIRVTERLERLFIEP